MKLIISILLLSLFMPVAVHAQADDPGDVLTILRANSLNTFADFLQNRAPNTLALIRRRLDITVYAPIDKAGAPSLSGAPTLHRRDARDEGIGGAQTMAPGKPPPQVNFQKRQQSLQRSNFEVLRTVLNDPTYINVGPGGYLSYVRNYAAPKEGPSDNGADMEINTGLGKIVNSQGSAIKYNKGLIYMIDDWFNLPSLLSVSLEAASMTAFQQAIAAANLTTTLDETAKITVFATKGELSGEMTVEGQVIGDFLGYTPELEPGRTYTSRAGTPIKITVEGGTFFANDCKIVEPNIPIKNGVAHYCEDSKSPAPISNTTAVSTAGTPNASSSSLPVQFVGSATTMVSGAGKAAIIGGMVAVIACMCM